MTSSTSMPSGGGSGQEIALAEATRRALASAWPEPPPVSVPSWMVDRFEEEIHLRDLDKWAGKPRADVLRLLQKGLVDVLDEALHPTKENSNTSQDNSDTAPRRAVEAYETRLRSMSDELLEQRRQWSGSVHECRVLSDLIDRLDDYPDDAAVVGAFELSCLLPKHERPTEILERFYYPDNNNESVVVRFSDWSEAVHRDNAHAAPMPGDVEHSDTDVFTPVRDWISSELPVTPGDDYRTELHAAVAKRQRELKARAAQIERQLEIVELMRSVVCRLRSEMGKPWMAPGTQAAIQLLKKEGIDVIEGNSVVGRHIRNLVSSKLYVAFEAVNIIRSGRAANWASAYRIMQGQLEDAGGGPVLAYAKPKDLADDMAKSGAYNVRVIDAKLRGTDAFHPKDRRDYELIKGVSA